MTNHLSNSTLPARDQALLFLHIPKAAGSTLRTVIERQFPPEVTFNVIGPDSRKTVKEFIELPEAQREKIRLVKGHMPYGLHKYLSVPATYITMLRDPVDRIISYYYFVLNSHRHYLHNEVTSRKMSLPEFVRSGLSTELTDDQTRLISGVERVNTRHLDAEERRTLRPGGEPVTSEILEVAKKNLRDHFSAVGLFSRFDESLLLFKRRLGWKNIYYVRQNVSRNRPAKQQVPGEVRDLIARQNEKDMELYEHAQAVFEESIREQGASFRSELRSFERNNRLYEIAWRGYTLTRGTIPKVKAAMSRKAGMKTEG
jgi:Sulfotransferase family